MAPARLGHLASSRPIALLHPPLLHSTALLPLLSCLLLHIRRLSPPLATTASPPSVPLLRPPQLLLAPPRCHRFFFFPSPHLLLSLLLSLQSSVTSPPSPVTPPDPRPPLFSPSTASLSPAARLTERRRPQLLPPPDQPPTSPLHPLTSPPSAPARAASSLLVPPLRSPHPPSLALLFTSASPHRCRQLPAHLGTAIHHLRPSTTPPFSPSASDRTNLRQHRHRCAVCIILDAGDFIYSTTSSMAPTLLLCCSTSTTSASSATSPSSVHLQILSLYLFAAHDYC